MSFPESQNAETPMWDDPNEILKLSRNTEVVRALSQYLGCTQKDVKDALTLRTTTGDRITYTSKKTGREATRTFDHGYCTYKTPKPNGIDMRTINIPAPIIMELQSRLLNIFRQIPISMAAKGGEPKSSIVDNVKPHIPNGFTVAMDVKDAFPSVDGQRLTANLKGFLYKQLEMSFPQLDEKTRRKFIQAIVTLIVKDDQLPQGAPTSTHLLNVVMAKTDADIFKLIHGDDSKMHNPSYTRYVDDLTISWKATKEFLEPWKLANRIKRSVAGVLGDPDELLNMDRPGIEKAIEGLESLDIDLGDDVEAKTLRSVLSASRQTLLDIKTEALTYEVFDLYKALDALIGRLDLVISEIEVDNSIMSDIQTDIRQRVANNGFKIKDSKTKVWTPSSSTAREITGVTISKDGRLGIPGKSMKRYIELARDAAINPENLPKDLKTRFGEPDPVKIARTLQGVRAFIRQVKRKAPKRFEDYYQQARNNFFEGWIASRKTQPIRYGNGY